MDLNAKEVQAGPYYHRNDKNFHEENDEIEETLPKAFHADLSVLFKKEAGEALITTTSPAPNNRLS